MHTLSMVLEVAGFAAVLVAALLLAGFGVTAWALNRPRSELLLAPVVGWAIVAVAFQLLTPVVPAWITVVLVLAVFGSFSIVVAWRRRQVLWHELSGGWLEAGPVTLIGLALYLGLLTYLFAAGFFTLAGWPSDNMEFYAPAGHYLQTHAFNPLHPLQFLDNPTTRYLARANSEFPNSVGTLDGAAAFLTGRQVYTLFDPLNAFLYALVIPGAYVLARRLGAGRLAALAALLLLSANQLLFWVMGLGFQQEIEAMPIFIGALALLLLAFQDDDRRIAALAGFLGGVTLGIYVPIFILFLILAFGSVVVHLASGQNRERIAARARQLVFAAGGGLAGAVVAVAWILMGEGHQFWLSVFKARYPAGGISVFIPLKFLLGMAPLTAMTWPTIPTPWWGPRWAQISHGLTLLVVALIAAGMVTVVLRRRLPALGLLGTALLYLLYLRFPERYPYGFMKTLTYLVPVTSTLIAMGAVDLVSTLRNRRPWAIELPSRAAVAGWTVAATLIMLTLAPVLVAEAMASTDQQRFWIRTGPTFPRSFEAMARFPELIPNGSGVLIVKESTSYAEEVKVSAARYYLIEDNVVVEDRVPSVIHLPAHYRYALLPDWENPGVGFRPIWSYGPLALTLYEGGRQG